MEDADGNKVSEYFNGPNIPLEYVATATGWYRLRIYASPIMWSDPYIGPTYSGLTTVSN